MERKQEEQARQMQELQAHVERLQRENDQLRALVDKSRDLGKDVQDGDRAEHPIACNKGKEPIIFGDSDAPTDHELSFGRFPSMSPPPGTNARGNIRAKSRRKHSHHPTLSDAVSGASHRAKERADKRHNQLLQAPRNPSVVPDGTMSLMPPMHPAFDVGTIFYTQLVALTCFLCP